ncbi:MAG TPA: prolipoprotein diacylglyceryl transferase family protein [Candidatus Saccharimonadales bacterium]|nr:prolipoprotein diacylglyceryl transferase family protein [Candidatus Saccharimonadales bacterium]
MNFVISPILFHVWGPLSVHAYGVFIAIGVCIGWVLVLHDNKLRSIISLDDLTVSFQLMLLSGFLGGRIIDILSQPKPIYNFLDLFKFWEPGFSILGSIIGIIVTTASYLYFKHIAILPYIDRMALYAPLVQSFGRMGCFFAGCCYGCPTSSWYSVMYQNPDHMAPLYQPLYPVQLYSSIMLMILFLFLFFIGQYHFKKQGILFCVYLACVSIERFFMDFMRWDREFIWQKGFLSYLSIHQWIALIVSICAIVSIIVINKWTKKPYGSV